MLRLRLALVGAVLVACAVVAFLLRPVADEDVPVVPTPPGAKRGEALKDPYAWTPERSAELSKRAAAGVSGLLFERSPGGAVGHRAAGRSASGRRSRRRRRPRA